MTDRQSYLEHSCAPNGSVQACLSKRDKALEEIRFWIGKVPYELRSVLVMTVNLLKMIDPDEKTFVVDGELYRRKMEDAEERAKDAEGRAKEAEERAKEAEERAKEAEERAKRATERFMALMEDNNALKAKLFDLQEEMDRLRARMMSTEKRMLDLD